MAKIAGRKQEQRKLLCPNCGGNVTPTMFVKKGKKTMARNCSKCGILTPMGKKLD